MTIRSATNRDRDGIWQILEPMIRDGDTYPLPRDMSRTQGLAYWFTEGHKVFVADEDDSIVGTYICAPTSVVAARTSRTVAT